MISKSRIKFIKSLQLKKYRKQEQCFTVEGAKSVRELMASDFKCLTLVCTDKFMAENKDVISVYKGEVIAVKPSELQQISEYNTNDSALAIANLKPNKKLVIKGGEYALVLDDIRDPGNLGTIIRTADWYGITKIIASMETADFYNNKVIQSTMGSFTRVSIFYTVLSDYLAKNKKPVYGTFLDGEDVHRVDFSGGGLIVMGNESNGISKEVELFVTKRITIPSHGKAESLNAAIATGIVCDNLRHGNG